MEELTFEDEFVEESIDEAVLPIAEEDWEFNNEAHENPLYVENDDDSREVITQPFTQQQLLAYYQNPFLNHDEVYTNRFLENSSEHNNSFHHLLLQFFQAVKNLHSLREDSENCCDQIIKTTERVFEVGQGQVNALAYCKDQRKVSTIHTFETCKVNMRVITELKSKFYETIRVSVDDVALAIYNVSIAQLECEQFIYESATMLNQSLQKFQENKEATSSSYLVQIVDESFDCIRQCLNSLFYFVCKEYQDVASQNYYDLLQTWIRQLVILLFSSSQKDAMLNEEMFVINHLIRCPPGVQSWAASLMQISSPNIGTDFWTYKPILDHVIYMLYLFLRPPKGRDKFLSMLKPAEMVVSVIRQDSVEEEKSWTFVKENGELTNSTLSNPWHVLPNESDMVSMFCQIPFESLLAHILALKFDRDKKLYTYAHKCDDSDQMLQTIACCDLLCDVLGEGLATLGAPKYKQLVRRIAQAIRNIVLLISEHWKTFKNQSESTKVQRHSVLRLQTEFDEFIRRCVERLLCVARLGVYQFLADLPFDVISQRAAEIIYVLMNVPAGSRAEVEQLSRTTYTRQEYIEFVQDTDTKLAFEDQLSSMPENEVVYLITAFSNLAQSRPTNEEHLVNIIAVDVFCVSFVYSSTVDICSKMGRELLFTIATIHPYIISTLLNFVSINEVSNTALFAIADLPFYLWKPTIEDINLLKNWLLNYSMSSTQSKFSQIAIKSLNWEIDENSGNLFLDRKFHCEIALALVEISMQYEEEKIQAGMIGKGMDQVSKMASVIKWTLTLEETFQTWLWDVLSHLKLHREQLPRSMDISVMDVNSSALLIQAIRMNLPVGCYVSLAMTNLGHSMNEFLQQGIRLLLPLSEANHKLSALKCVLFVLPMFVKAEIDLSINNLFLTALNSIVRSSPSLLEGITSKITDNDKSQLFVNLMCGAIQTLTEKESEYTNTLIMYFVKMLLSLQTWHSDANICELLNFLLKCSFHNGARSVDECKAIIYQQTTEVLLNNCKDNKSSPQHQNKSMMSSIWGLLTNNSVQLAPSFYTEFMTQYTYLSFFILQSETRYEDDSKFWSTLLYFMRTNNPDVAVKKAANANKLTHTPALHQVSFYRWANQVISTDVNHPIFFIICQQFFLRYIYIQSDGTGSLGQKFFKVYPSAYRKLEEKFAYTSTIEKSTENLNNENAYLLPVFQKWLEEPKLHDNNLYIASLTSHFKPEFLVDVRTHKQDLWLALVDFQQIANEIYATKDEWLQFRKPKDKTKIPTHSSSMSINMTNCQRITQLLRQFEMPKSLPISETPKITCPVEKINISSMKTINDVENNIDQDLKSISSYATSFFDMKSKLENMNKVYLEMLPDLFSMEPASKWINIECHSAFSATHKCSGAAHVELKFEQKTLNLEVSQLLQLNRSSYNELVEMITDRNSVAELCYAFLHIKSVIDALNINYESSLISSEDKISIKSAGSKLFYILADMNSGDHWKCSTTQLLLSTGLELLGPVFISGHADQALPLLNQLLKFPKIAGLLSTHFSPLKACLCSLNRQDQTCAFVDMYERVVTEVSNQDHSDSSDVLFVLITKFDIETWLTKHEASQTDRLRVLNIVVKGLCYRASLCSNSSSEVTLTSQSQPISPVSLASQITFSNYAVQEIFTSHFCTLLNYSLEDIFFQAICAVLSASEIQNIDSTAWEALLSAAFQSNERVLSVYDRNENHVVDPNLSYDVALKCVQYLAVYFDDARKTLIKKDTDDSSLYKTWSMYIEPVANLLHCLCVTIIHYSFKGDNVVSATTILNDITLPLYNPWIEPIEKDNIVLWAWSDKHETYAEYILNSLASVLFHLCSKSQSDFDKNKFLSCTWKFYIENTVILKKKNVPVYICSSFQTVIHPLPWNNFIPDIVELDQMIGLVESKVLNCIHFICFLYPKIEWENIVESCKNQSTVSSDCVWLPITQDLLCRFLHILLVLASQPNRLVSYPDLVNLFNTARCFPWHCITFNQFDYISGIVADRYSAECLVKKVVEDVKTKTKIMVEPRYVVVELLQVVCNFNKTNKTDDQNKLYPSVKNNALEDSEIWLKRQSYISCCGMLVRKSEFNLDSKQKIQSLIVTVTQFLSNLLKEISVTIQTEYNNGIEGNNLFGIYNELWKYVVTFPTSLQPSTLRSVLNNIKNHIESFTGKKNSTKTPVLAFDLRNQVMVSLVQSACIALTNPEYLVQALECLLEICMHEISVEDTRQNDESNETDVNSLQIWKKVVYSMRNTQITNSNIFEAAIASNSFLTLYATCINLFDNSSIENVSETIRENAYDSALSIVQWMSAVSPTSENEIKILFWFDYFFHVCVFLLKLTAENSDTDINIFSVTDVLGSIIPVLEQWSVDKIRSGLLGTIGIGRSSPLSLQFRILTRTLIVFIKLHISLLIPSDEEQKMKADEQLKMFRELPVMNKSYVDFTDCIKSIYKFLDEDLLKIQNYHTLLALIIDYLFPNHKYVKLLFYNKNTNNLK